MITAIANGITSQNNSKKSNISFQKGSLVVTDAARKLISGNRDLAPSFIEHIEKHVADFFEKSTQADINVHISTGEKLNEEATGLFLQLIAKCSGNEVKGNKVPLNVSYDNQQEGFYKAFRDTFIPVASKISGDWNRY